VWLGILGEVAVAEAHQALFYRDRNEYLEGIWRFIAPVLGAGDPVAIAVPTPKLRLLRERLGHGHASKIELLDMTQLGRNPGRMVSAVQAISDRSSGRLHYVGEAIWPGRSPEEICEATRHEALMNLAWPNGEVRVLCPYDAVGLDEAVLSDAERTHPGLVRDGCLDASPAYGGPRPPPACEAPLPKPPAEAVAVAFDAADLGGVRAMVAERATVAGLRRERVAEVVLAVNELTTNSVKHAGTGGTVRVWTEPGELICQVEDAGRISDPLAGRKRGLAGVGGLGLWMVNQLCDLVQVRTGPAGSTVRVHAR
jgi:anti-sigma regulatory factor (Ser/Thr protein kinase)